VTGPGGRRAVAYGVALAAASAVERLILWAVYAPISYGDTGSYFRSAGALVDWTLGGLDGTRVPGYPAFVALVGIDPARVFAAQLLLGWLLTMVLFVWTWQAARKPLLGLVVGACYTFIPGTFFFEANLLTETLSAFLIVAAFALLLWLERTRGTASASIASVGLGLVSGLAGLTRILFYPLTIWLLPFVWNAARARWPTRLLRSILFLVPALGLLLGWVSYVDEHYGFLAPTTMGGYNLVQHTGLFFQYLPDEDAAIRDTYLRYRDARLAERGDQTNTIWEAIPELSRVSGLGFYDLSRELQRLSLQLIREHPGLYLRNVVEGWIAFWKAPVYWEPDQLSPAWLAMPVRWWAIAGRAITLAANAAFLFLSGWVVVRLRRWKPLLADSSWLAPWGFLWVTSILQTIADHGDNPRFLIPLQAIVFYVVLRAVDFWLPSRRSAADDPTGSPSPAGASAP
jgi:hypothetical protein